MTDYSERAKELLKQPYRRVLIPDGESGGYFAQIAEFPGCFAEGNSPAAAYRKLERVAESWIEAALDMGQQIPQAEAEHEYSGKLVVRMPRSLHKTLARLAENDNTSLNGFIVAALAEKAGAVQSRTVSINFEQLNGVRMYSANKATLEAGVMVCQPGSIVMEGKGNAGNQANCVFPQGSC